MNTILVLWYEFIISQDIENVAEESQPVQIKRGTKGQKKYILKTLIFGGMMSRNSREFSINYIYRDFPPLSVIIKGAGTE